MVEAASGVNSQGTDLGSNPGEATLKGPQLCENVMGLRGQHY